MPIPIGPILAGAAQLGSAALGLKGNKNAGRQQQQSNDAALAWERERYAMEQKERAEERAAAERAWNEREQMRAPARAAAASIWARYGIRVPNSGPRPYPGAGTPPAPPSAPPAGSSSLSSSLAGSVYDQGQPSTTPALEMPDAGTALSAFLSGNRARRA